MKIDYFEKLALLGYQSAFAATPARFKIGLWARQTGKDHTVTAEAVLDCQHNPGTTWIILAAGERQALESLAKAKEWAEVLKYEIDEYIETPANVPLSIARQTSSEIRWSNGSRLLALPGNPHTVRGYSANLILTEFAFHEDTQAIWRAIYPSISNPIRGGEKKLRIISTPNGLNNKFADLWHKGENYSKHFIDIYTAVQEGLKLNIDELKAGLNDPDAWAQEYECKFMDTTSILLPYDLIQSCESYEAGEVRSDFSPVRGSNRFFLGIDFARKNHLTVAWLLERIPSTSINPNVNPNPNPNHYVTREVLTLKNMSTPEQVTLLRPRLALASRVSVDYTGGGIGLGDYLVQEFGEWNPAAHRTGKVELCQFTPALKGELFPKLRAAFERKEILIPSSREIREDLHSIHRIVSTTGQISYRSSQSGDGHSDRCTALALAFRAATSVPVTACAETVYVRGMPPISQWARDLIRKPYRFR